MADPVRDPAAIRAGIERARQEIEQSVHDLRANVSQSLNWRTLVRRHPGSQRKTLYLSAHASHIVGWPVPEGRILLYDLNLHATRPEFVYSHKWRVGDLVIWDNRCTMHRGRPYDDAQRRVLHRTTVSDVANTLELEGLVATAAA